MASVIVPTLSPMKSFEFFFLSIHYAFNVFPTRKCGIRETRKEMKDPCSCSARREKKQIHCDK